MWFLGGNSWILVIIFNFLVKYVKYKVKNEDNDMKVLDLGWKKFLVIVGNWCNGCREYF